MRIRRGWLVLGVLGAVVGAAVAADVEGPKKVELLLTSNVIDVTNGGKCTKLKSAVLKSGTPLKWSLGSGVTDFHAVFPVTPFTSGRTYVDSHTVASDLVLLTPDEEAQDFKFVIAVDGGSTCDPHVIIIK